MADGHSPPGNSAVSVSRHIARGEAQASASPLTSCDRPYERPSSAAAFFFGAAFFGGRSFFLGAALLLGGGALLLRGSLLLRSSLLLVAAAFFGPALRLAFFCRGLASRFLLRRFFRDAHRQWLSPFDLFDLIECGFVVHAWKLPCWRRPRHLAAGPRPSLQSPNDVGTTVVSDPGRGLHVNEASLSNTWVVCCDHRFVFRTGQMSIDVLNTTDDIANRRSYRIPGTLPIRAIRRYDILNVNKVNCLYA